MKLPAAIADAGALPSKAPFFMMNVLLSLCTAGFMVLIGLIINFYPSGNDLWDNHYLAMTMSFSDIRSLYDGFFPIGYSLLLKALVGSHFPVHAAFFINVFLSLLLFLTVARYLGKNNLNVLFPIWLFLLILFPRSFQYFITPGPDIAAAALFTIGMIMHLSRFDASESYRHPKRSRSLSIAGGLCMGAAALIRYHAFPASFFFLSALFLIGKKDRKSTALSGAAVLVAYLPQLLVNILSGHGPLETYHALNLYNLVYSVNWFHMEKLIPLPSAKSIIFGAPVLFITHYSRWFIELAVFALPPLAYGFFAKKEDKFLGLCAAGFCLLYALFFGVSASPRAVLLVVPISLLFFVKTLFSAGLPKRIKTAIVFVSLACVCLFIYKDVLRVAFCKNSFSSYAGIETFLIAQGVKDAHETFTCDYDLYFKTLFPYRPLFNGGWGRVATYKYSEFFPELSVDSLPSFYEDCLRRRVRYIIINPNAPKLAGFLNDLYTGGINDPRFTAVFFTGDKKVFRVVRDDSYEPKKNNPL